MRVLLIDNYDSFAFNLVQALRVLGADVIVRRNDALGIDDLAGLDPSAIVLSPGPKGPDAAGISVPLVRAAATRGLPLLGVCLGHQAIAAAFGGAVVRAARLVHGKTSFVHHAGDALYAGVASPFEAMRYHSLIVPRDLPADLVATAWCVSADGDAGASSHAAPSADGELMGLRHRSLPIHGVQFHPESYRTGAGPTILGNFLRLAAHGGP